MFSWFDQVGFGRNTWEGNYCFKNSKPILKDPVPERHWAVTTLPSFSNAESFPNMSFWLPELKLGIPSIGMYSWVKIYLLYLRTCQQQSVLKLFWRLRIQLASDCRLCKHLLRGLPFCCRYHLHRKCWFQE